MKRITGIFICLIVFLPAFVGGQEGLPRWEKGYMDIHHINTGCGECTYIIFPDGTTMLVDAGENSDEAERHIPAKPDKSKTPAEWIVDYIDMFQPESNKELDYVLLTHFHSDHIGGDLLSENFNGKYHETGITKIAGMKKIHSLIDRGYPEYDFLCDETDPSYLNYQSFLINHEFQFNQEPFHIGSDSQFTPKKDNSITGFKILNIYANGNLWKQTENKTEQLFPMPSTLPLYDIPRENSLSTAIKIMYGNFSYYTGGDISGYPRPGRSAFHDVETPLSKEIGKVDICVVNHHGNNDGTNDTFISNLKPRFFLILASDALHPNHTALYRMFSKELYPEKRDVLSTNMHPATAVVIGSLIYKMKSREGHIVVRVAPGGDNYEIYILNDSSSKRFITKQFGPYESKSLKN